MENGDIVSVKTWRGSSGPRKLKIISYDRLEGFASSPFVRMVDEDGKRHKLKPSQLVCRAFHGKRPSNKHEARHLDGNIHNNHKDNLAWLTRQEYYAMKRELNNDNEKI